MRAPEGTPNPTPHHTIPYQTIPYHTIPYHTHHTTHHTTPHYRTDLRVSIRALDPGTPESDAVKHGHVIANNRSLAHHNACAVVDEHTLPELGAGVYVYLELLRDLG